MRKTWRWPARSPSTGKKSPVPVRLRPLAVFRLDASPEIGAGHAARCATLADALVSWGWETLFVCNPGAETAAPQLKSRPLRPIPPHRPDDAAPFKATLPRRASLVVIDHYGLSAGFETAIRADTDAIFVIDDLCNRRHDCDFLLDPTLGRLPQDYAALLPTGARALTGASFVLLPKAFRAKRAGFERRTEAVAQRVLISLGATDPANATVLAIEAVAASGHAVEVDIVLGRAAPHIETVRALAQKRLADFTLHIDPPDLPDIVARCDMAIGASGSSAWERSALGLPTILLAVAENQVPSARAFAETGAAILAGQEAIASPQILAGMVGDLIGDAKARHDLSERAAALCDGRALERIRCALAGTVSRPDGKSTGLRAVETEDRDRLLAWRSDPTTVQFSLNARAPDPDEHRRWFDARLARDDLFAILETGNAPVGVVRLEPRILPVDRPAFEVSIAIAPEARGTGLGTVALQLLRAACPSDTISATVVADNQVSRRLFEAAGYVPTGMTDQLISEPYGP
jgi:UDP-2,4-diacetamido-2,4,6-trideoxy-beta-L-altropyranose hydrolase